MKSSPVQKRFETSNDSPRSLQAASRLFKGLSLGLAGLLLASPVLAPQASANVLSSQAVGFEQTALARVNTDLEPSLGTRTSLLSPEIDETLANTLLWMIYLGFPLGIIVAVWRYDQRDRDRMAKFIEQIAMLERIWQNPHAHE
ncbi:MAG: hypothetical protein HY785_11175 [Oscillatoriophycideae cyanobacterium NC_groundwater_1537_Pr4_S-0.65um_50_18]|nr:hypothetical protein [Oscillatoriophycideae cyanobacterium NC_groundwater_1537_Pr4_S-0.65um_50_18]